MDFLERRPSSLSAVILILAMVMASCGYSGIVNSNPTSAWLATLNGPQLDIVLQVFPSYLPPLFAPDVQICDRSSLVPSNYSPAEFFGAPHPQGLKPTPHGVMVETNGFDSPDFPALLPLQGIYFDCHGNSFTYALGAVSESPLNLVESKLGRPPTPGAATETIDLREGRVTLDEIDSTLTFVQQQLAIALPQVANVDPHNCQVVIEPSVFYVADPANGNTWAGGMSESLGGGGYRIHVLRFHMNQQVVPSDLVISNWREVLVFEAMNCYVLSIDRPELTYGDPLSGGRVNSKGPGSGFDTAH